MTSSMDWPRGKADLREPGGLHVSPQERFICQVETRGADIPRDHIRATAEEILVVTVERSAISEDQARLSLAPRAAAALGVIGRGRGDVAQVNQVEVGDVHAQLHGRRAHQVGQPATQLGFLPRVAVLPAEPAFPALALAGLDHLRSVLSCLKRRQRGGRLAVEPLEERIHRGRKVGVTMDAGSTGIDRVNGRRAAVAQSPAQACRVKLEELVIIHGIKPDQEPLANQECEQTVKKDRVFTRAEVEPQTQKLTDRAQFVQAEALYLAWGTAWPDESVCRPQLVELRIQSPELVEVLLRSSPDLLLVHFLQAAARHRQLATELIEHRPNERLPPCYRQPGHARMKTPASPVGTHVFQSPIAHAEQTDMLQVRLDDPPTAAEIFVEPALCQVGERAPDVLRRAGVRVQLGVAGNVAEAETARVNDSMCYGVKGQITLPL